MGELIPIVSILAVFIGLPSIVVAAIIGSKYIRYKNEELSIRKEELEIARQRLQLETLERENRLLDRKINEM